MTVFEFGGSDIKIPKHGVGRRCMVPVGSGIKGYLGERLTATAQPRVYSIKAYTTFAAASAQQLQL